MPKVSLHELSKLENAVFRSKSHKGRTVISVPKNHVSDSFSKGCEIFHATNPKQSSGATLWERFFGEQANSKISVETGSSIEIAKTAGTKIAKQAELFLPRIKYMFEEALKGYGIEKKVHFSIRGKDKEGATKKTVKETLEVFNAITKHISSVQNSKKVRLNIEEILPELSEKAPASKKRLLSSIREELQKHSKDDTVSLFDARKIIAQKTKEKAHSKRDSRVFDAISKRIQKAHSKQFFDTLQYINFERGALDDITKSVRDAIGVRFTILPQNPTKLKKLTYKERVSNATQYMENKGNQITNILEEIVATEDSRITRLRNYEDDKDPANYLSKRNIQKLANSSPSVRVQAIPEKNGYRTSQGNMVMQTNGEIPLRKEFQVRGHLVHELAESEHIIYDISSGKKINSKKYPKEKRPVIEKITIEVKKLKTDKVLKNEYDNYIKECYRYKFAKERGKNPHKPVLPTHINNCMSMDSLIDLENSKIQK